MFGFGSTSRSSIRARFALLALLAAAPHTAQPQFGGLIKRAIGQKVVEKVTDKVTQKADGQKTDSAAGTIAPATSVPGASAAGATAPGVDVSPIHDDKPSAIRTCLEDAYFTVAQLRAKELQSRAKSDPLLLRRYAEAWPKYGAAAQEASVRADTAAIRRVMMAYYREVFGASLISAQDTLTAHRKCRA